MNELQLTGNTSFMGKSIPVLLGGFGEDKRCISDKTISEIHGMETKNIRARVTDNLIRFKENVDFIDIGQRACDVSTSDLLEKLGYAKQSITQAEHIYLLSERGYAKLIKIMDTDLAWDIHDKLIDEYFELREQKANLSELSPQLQLLISIETKQKAHDIAIADTNKRLDGIADIISLDNNAWREECRHMIVKIANSMGGTDYIREVNSTIYNLLDARFAVSLERRLSNARRRMAEDGVNKSKRDKLSKVDIIAEDKKLIEAYLIVIKELAIKYGVWKDEK